MNAGPIRETDFEPHNEVILVGRVSTDPLNRDLPSGDPLVTLRVVVPRPQRRGVSRRAVDVIDVACWTSATRRSADRLVSGDKVRIEGALRRRVFGVAGQRSSRYEVESTRLVKLR